MVIWSSPYGLRARHALLAALPPRRGCDRDRAEAGAQLLQQDVVERGADPYGCGVAEAAVAPDHRRGRAPCLLPRLLRQRVRRVGADRGFEASRSRGTPSRPSRTPRRRWSSSAPAS